MKRQAKNEVALIDKDMARGKVKQVQGKVDLPPTSPRPLLKYYEDFVISYTRDLSVWIRVYTLLYNSCLTLKS